MSFKKLFELEKIDLELSRYDSPNANPFNVLSCESAISNVGLNKVLRQPQDVSMSQGL